eukprot:gene39241-47755_t
MWTFFVFATVLWAIAAHRTVYKVLIDSGSTGSRVYIYRYLRENPLLTMREVAHMRARPALSTFYQNRTGLEEQIHSLVDFAQKTVASRYHGSTAISLKATAGLRSLPITQQDWIISQVREILTKSNFSFNPVETKVISGGEEALFALLATNMAFTNVTGDFSLTLGAADMGGSSQQIAFALPPRAMTLTSITQSLAQLSWSSLWSIFQPPPPACPPDFVLTLPPSPSSSSTSIGAAQPIEIFAQSIAGLGIVAAMEEVFELMAKRYMYEVYGQQHTQAGETEFCPVLSPLVHESSSSSSSCLPNFSPLLSWYGVDYHAQQPQQAHNNHNHTPAPPLRNPCVSASPSPFPYPASIAHLPWEGTGDFDQCAGWVRQVVESRAGGVARCMRELHWGGGVDADGDGKPAEPSGSAWSLGTLGGIGNMVSHSKNNYNGKPSKRTPPTSIIGMDNFPKVLEVMNLTRDTGISPYTIRQRGREVCRIPWQDILDQHPDYPAYRAQNVCFGGVFIYTILTSVYHVEKHDEVSFVPTDEHHHFTVGWPLGAALYH